MRKILIIIGFLSIPLLGLAITGDNARFDFTQGQPTIVDDTTSTCNNQATVRYDFTSGEPRGVYDTTATCTAISVVEVGVITPFVYITNARVAINNARVTIGF